MLDIRLKLKSLHTEADILDAEIDQLNCKLQDISENKAVLMKRRDVLHDIISSYTRILKLTGEKDDI